MNYTSKGIGFVIIQVLLFVAFLFNVQVGEISFPSGITKLGVVLFNVGVIIIIVSLIQLNRNLSPFPIPKENGALIQNGLYSMIRHPIYTGILITFLGSSIRKDSFYKLSITALLFLLFYFKSKYEERLLIDEFDEYKTYIKKTKRFIPFLF